MELNEETTCSRCIELDDVSASLLPAPVAASSDEMLASCESLRASKASVAVGKLGDVMATLRISTKRVFSHQLSRVAGGRRWKWRILLSVENSWKIKLSTKQNLNVSQRGTLAYLERIFDSLECSISNSIKWCSSMNDQKFF